jgi:hypothetical protein
MMIGKEKIKNMFEVKNDNRWNLFDIETRKFKFENWLFDRKSLYI